LEQPHGAVRRQGSLVPTLARRFEPAVTTSVAPTIAAIAATALTMRPE
jgi:hypothetical protein